MLIATVAVPYISTERQLSLAEQTLNSIVSSKHRLLKIGIINGYRDQRDLTWAKQAFNYNQINQVNCLAQAWNIGINYAFKAGADYVLVTNLDLVLRADTIDKLVDFAIQAPEAVIWAPSAHQDLASLEHVTPNNEISQEVCYSCFMLDRKLFAAVGEFDPDFIPAYYEDRDMQRRINLAGLKALTTNTSHYFHFERGTVKCFALAGQEDLVIGLDQLREKNRLRYIEKWGGDFGEERYLTGFNR